MRKKQQIIVFLLMIAIMMSISIGPGNKHFVRFGVEKVEASSTKVQTIQVNDFRIYTEIYTGSNWETTAQEYFSIGNYIPDKKPGTDVKITGTISWTGTAFTGDSVTSGLSKSYRNLLDDYEYGSYSEFTKAGTKTYNNTTIAENKASIFFRFQESGGYYSWRMWTATFYIDVDLTVEYTPINNDPTIIVTTPSPNGTLQPWIMKCKEVA